MNLSAPLSLNDNLKGGDRVFLRFNAQFVGESVAKKLADFVSAFNTEKALRLLDYELEGNPIFDPVAGTVNAIVRVKGTPVVVIVISLAAIAAGVALFLTLREARLILSATAGAIQDVGEGVQATGTGLGVGLAFAGVIAAAFLLGFLDLKG